MNAPEEADVQQPADLQAAHDPNDRFVQLCVVVDGTRFPVTGFGTLAELQAAVRAAIDDRSVLELQTRDDDQRTVGVLLLVGAQLDAVAVLGLTPPPLNGRPSLDRPNM